MKLYIVKITRLFPLWALLFTLLAWWQPSLFSDYRTMIMPLLSLVMFGMGLGLHVSDFSRALNMPRLIVLGVGLQYGIMPIAALGISMLLKLDPVLTAGMVLVGASPGGTASNVICYLARGNVALSITLTAISTLLSVILTPLLALLLIDVHITVPAGDMLLRIRGRIMLKRLPQISPLAVPVMLEIGREPVVGEAHDDILAEAAADSIIALAMGDAP